VCNNTPCLEPPKVWCPRLQSVRSIAKSDTAMSAPEESDSRNASFKFRWSWLHLLDSLVYFFPNTYIIWLSNLLTLSWKWLQKRVVCTKLYIIYVFIQSRVLIYIIYFRTTNKTHWNLQWNCISFEDKCEIDFNLCIIFY
jgi:hypothetical protein